MTIYISNPHIAVVFAIVVVGATKEPPSLVTHAAFSRCREACIQSSCLQELKWLVFEKQLLYTELSVILLLTSNNEHHRSFTYVTRAEVAQAGWSMNSRGEGEGDEREEHGYGGAAGGVRDGRDTSGAEGVVTNAGEVSDGRARGRRAGDGGGDREIDVGREIAAGNLGSGLPAMSALRSVVAPGLGKSPKLGSG